MACLLVSVAQSGVANLPAVASSHSSLLAMPSVEPLQTVEGHAHLAGIDVTVYSQPEIHPIGVQKLIPSIC